MSSLAPIQFTVTSLSAEVVKEFEVDPASTVHELGEKMLEAFPPAPIWVTAEAGGGFAQGDLVQPDNDAVFLGDKGLWRVPDGTVIVLHQHKPPSWIKLLKSGVELVGTSTLMESQVVNGDVLTFVRIHVPPFRMLTGAPPPTLQPGDLGAMTTNVQKQHGGVTRQDVKCASPYKIHLCRAADISTSVRNVSVDPKHVAILHRKTGPRTSTHAGAVIDARIEHRATNGAFSSLIIFEGGFPNGGETFADVHAPWGTVLEDIPRDGSVIIEVGWEQLG